MFMQPFQTTYKLASLLRWPLSSLPTPPAPIPPTIPEYIEYKTAEQEFSNCDQLARGEPGNLINSTAHSQAARQINSARVHPPN